MVLKKSTTGPATNKISHGYIEENILKSYAHPDAGRQTMVFKGHWGHFLT